jgi:hypothetical protein
MLKKASAFTRPPRYAETSRSTGKAVASEEARRTLRYVELLSDVRTPLADFFSILLRRQQLFDLFREMADLALSLDYLALKLGLSIMASETIVERACSEGRPCRMVRIPRLAVR